MLQIALAGARQDIHAIHIPQCPPRVSLWAGSPAAVASWGPCPVVTQASLLPTQLCSVRGARCMRPVAPRAPPRATTTVPSLGGPAGPSPVWRAASAPRGLCCTVCRVRVGRGEGALGMGVQRGHKATGCPFGRSPAVCALRRCLPGASCLPLRVGGQLLPAGHGTAEGLWQLVSRGAGGCPHGLGWPSPAPQLIPGHHVLSTCRESQWLCGDDGGRCAEPGPGCAEGEIPCRESGHCVPHGWLCDNQDDCGDGSDEEGECPGWRAAVASGGSGLRWKHVS